MADFSKTMSMLGTLVKQEQNKDVIWDKAKKDISEGKGNYL